MLTGTFSEEVKVKATAAEAWNVYGTLKLSQLLVEKLPHFLQKVDILEGDGGVGTVFKVFFVPGNPVWPGLTYQIEKLTVVDDENRVKVVEVIEGGYLALGFTHFRIRLQVLENDENNCITRASVEYEIEEDESDKISFVSAESFVAMMNAIADTLTKTKEDV